MTEANAEFIPHRRGGARADHSTIPSLPMAKAELSPSYTTSRRNNAGLAGSNDRVFSELHSKLGAAVAARNSQFTAAKIRELVSFTASSARQCRVDIPNLPPTKAENLADFTAAWAIQCRSNPVSDQSLPKTGVFQMSAGDYRLLRSENAQNRSLET
jgi:hypothetical protein